ncbi:MAG TPA: YutD family protein [Cerasibacillus sp.]
MITIEDMTYELVKDVRDGFQEEAFKERYSDILKKYDYIVGDWGYDQLRLKGFYDDFHKKASHDTRISTLQDYIYEYCNFGCAYFVVKKKGRAGS